MLISLRRQGGLFCLRRVCALLTLIAFTAGLFGVSASVPLQQVSEVRGDGNLLGGTQERDKKPSAEELVVLDSAQMSCCCASTSQAASTCCCSQKTIVVQPKRACCSSRDGETDSAPDKHQKQPTGGTWLSCPCGSLSASLLFVCGEPRLLNSGTVVQTPPPWCAAVEITMPHSPTRNLSPETPPPRQLGC
ncbi:MAG: hypothetical protein HON53_13470 [Planctomycetaceae bacterium]|nr:hypothetical protein [Planctomycetaceae bacterium]MBT6154499.1 hypothetical protein [Planctomycetaceae bacterium]MBT6486529.1 hypothetical protein [Planctomycetaceae bacterium]MBT6497956.1 hypothetical protein [Planctomycetaceae bacterium]